MHRHLARDRGDEPRGGPRPGAARVHAAGGVEQDPGRARGKGGPGSIDRGRGRGLALGPWSPPAARRAAGGRPSRRVAEGADEGIGFVAAELDRVGIDRGHDAASSLSDRSAVIATMAGRRSAAAIERANAARSRASSSDSARGVPGHEVQADGVRTGPDGRMDPGRRP